MQSIATRNRQGESDTSITSRQVLRFAGPPRRFLLLIIRDKRSKSRSVRRAMGSTWKADAPRLRATDIETCAQFFDLGSAFSAK